MLECWAILDILKQAMAGQVLFPPVQSNAAKSIYHAFCPPYSLQSGDDPADTILIWGEVNFKTIVCSGGCWLQILGVYFF